MLLQIKDGLKNILVRFEVCLLSYKPLQTSPKGRLSTHSPDISKWFIVLKCLEKFQKYKSATQLKFNQGTQAGYTIIQLTLLKNLEIKKDLSNQVPPLGDRGLLPLYPSATITFHQLFYIT